MTTINKSITSSVLTALESYEKHLDNAQSCINDVSVNIHLAIKNNLIAQPNLKNADSKMINSFAEKFALDVLGITDWNKTSSAKKTCLRRAIPLGVATVKADALSEVKGKNVSKQGKIYLDGSKLPEHLNKDNMEVVALTHKDADKWAKTELNFSESKNKSSALELAITKVIAELDNCYDQNGLIDLPNSKCRSVINTLFNKLTTFKAELNAQSTSSKDEMTAKNITFENPNSKKAVNS